MTYGAVGRNPLADLPSSIEHLLAGLIQQYYSQSVTGIAKTAVNWEMWWSNYGDVSIYFQNASDQVVGKELGWRIRDHMHYTDIHIFVRRNIAVYDRSAEELLFKFDKLIKQILMEHKQDLLTSGVLSVEYQRSRMTPSYNEQDNTQRLIISVISRYRLVA